MLVLFKNEIAAARMEADAAETPLHEHSG